MPIAHWRNALHESIALLKFGWKKQSVHDIHSPFVFDLITNVLHENRDFGIFESIESHRLELLNDHRFIEVSDFGAGSRTFKSDKRKISDIAVNTLQSQSHAQLFFRLVNFLQPKTILELGTSLGITSAYLATADTKARMISIEGAESLAGLARTTAEKLSVQNLKILTGTFDDMLPLVLEELKHIDFALIDGNHRYISTIRYFNSILEYAEQDACMIFDDIHWSPEMEMAWQEILSHSRITLSLDFFDFGIVFLGKRHTREHFYLTV